MALRDQPYIPLYVQDFETDEKLIYCSALSTGVYIRIMCHMHKSEEYGTILLKQNFKQTSKPVENFALQLAKILPYDVDVIEQGLSELIAEKVLHIEGDYLIQKRMVRDNEISMLRAKNGKKGGIKTQKKFASSFAKAKPQANTEYENEYEYNNNKGIVLENLTPVDEAIGPELSECKKIVESDQIWVEAFCMNNRITIPQFKTFLTDFFKKLQDEGETRRTPKDAKRHFANWVKIQNKASNGTEQPKKTYRRFSDTATPQR